MLPYICANCYITGLLQIFVDPMGNRFRSKKKVLSFLATGVLPRRRAKRNPNLVSCNFIIFILISNPYMCEILGLLVV